MNSFMWALLTALVWGCVPVIEKLGLMKMSPIVGLFYRCLGVVLGIVVLLAFRGKDIRASLADVHPGMLFLVVGGLLASVIGQFFLSGLEDRRGLAGCSHCRGVSPDQLYPRDHFSRRKVYIGQGGWARARFSRHIFLKIILRDFPSHAKPQ